jgi:hypothetical protein
MSAEHTELVQQSWQCLMHRMETGQDMSAVECWNALQELNSVWSELPRQLILDLIEYSATQRREALPEQRAATECILITATHIHMLRHIQRQQ